MTGVEEGAGVTTRMLEVLKDLPLWLLSGLAVAAGVLLVIPKIAASLPTGARPWIVIAGVVFGVLALARGLGILIENIPVWKVSADKRRRFHLIPDPQQSLWSISKQADDSIVTQVVARFLTKNRTTETLALVQARLIRPKIRGEIIHSDVLVRAVDENIYGSAAHSGHAIPAGMSLPTSVHILIRGVPRRAPANHLRAVIGVTDDEGHEQRVAIDMRVIPQPEAVPVAQVEMVSSITNPIEKEIANVLQAELSRYQKCGRLVGGLGSIHWVIKGRELTGVGTVSWSPSSPKNQNVFEGPEVAELRSDNMEALLAFYQRLSTSEQRDQFATALLDRLDGKGYLSISYFVVCMLWKLGRLPDALNKSKAALPQGEIKAFGLSNVLMLLNGLLHYRYPEFTNEMLEEIEKFIVGLKEHPFQIPEKIAAIRTARLIKR